MQTDVAVRLIAPFRCQFNLDNTFISVESEKFTQFLQCIEEGLADPKSGLKDKLEAGLNIQVQEHDHRNIGPRYVSLNEVGSLFHSPGYLDIYFEPSRKGELEAEFRAAYAHADKETGRHFSKLVEANFESLFFSVYDHTIGILTLDIELDAKEVQEHPEEWSGLDGWTTHFMHHLLDFLYPKFIHPTLDAISDYVAPHFRKVIVPPEEHVIYHDMLKDERNESSEGQLLWVNRTLLCPKGIVLKGWTNKKLDEKSSIIIDDAEAHLFSGNSIVEMKRGLKGHDLRHLWQGLYIGQYYYAAMDVSSKNISRYVGLSYITKNNKAIRKLSEDMEFVINVITIFQVRYKDLYVELQGMPLQVFQRLEKEWDFNFIFNNVQNKINLCKSNVSRLNQLINQRNQLRVQLVLAIVAGMSLVTLMLQISRFSLQLGRDAIEAPDEVLGLLNIATHFTPNQMLWIGCFLAVLVVMTILYNRPR